MTALPPAETVMHLVRAACDAVAPNSACIWPSCNCLIGIQRNDILAALIAAAKAEEKERIAEALDNEADLTPCTEDAMVTRDCALLVRADFSYTEADRLSAETDNASATTHTPAPGGGGS